MEASSPESVRALTPANNTGKSIAAMSAEGKEDVPMMVHFGQIDAAEVKRHEKALSAMNRQRDLVDQLIALHGAIEYLTPPTFPREAITFVENKYRALHKMIMSMLVISDGNPLEARALQELHSMSYHAPHADISDGPAPEFFIHTDVAYSLASDMAEMMSNQPWHIRAQFRIQLWRAGRPKKGEDIVRIKQREKTAAKIALSAPEEKLIEAEVAIVAFGHLLEQLAMIQSVLAPAAPLKIPASAQGEEQKVIVAPSDDVDDSGENKKERNRDIAFKIFSTVHTARVVTSSQRSLAEQCIVHFDDCRKDPKNTAKKTRFEMICDTLAEALNIGEKKKTVGELITYEGRRAHELHSIRQQQVAGFLVILEATGGGDAQSQKKKEVVIEKWRVVEANYAMYMSNLQAMRARCNEGDAEFVESVHAIYELKRNFPQFDYFNMAGLLVAVAEFDKAMLQPPGDEKKSVAAAPVQTPAPEQKPDPGAQ